MYLTRLVLNPRHRAVQRDLADCQAMHRTVMSLFPQSPGGPARTQMGVLYRLETNPHAGGVNLLIQSEVRPDWSGLPPGYLQEPTGPLGNPACKAVDEQYAAIATGERLRFRLRANPTRKVDTHSGPGGERRNGRRVGLGDEEAQLAWLSRKGEQCGFALLNARAAPSVVNVRSAPEARLVGWRAQGSGDEERETRRLTFAPVLFEGELRVTDAERFREALGQGIGPAKAYGFGLLSVAPVER